MNSRIDLVLVFLFIILCCIVPVLKSVTPILREHFFNSQKKRDENSILCNLGKAHMILARGKYSQYGQYSSRGLSRSYCYCPFNLNFKKTWHIKVKEFFLKLRFKWWTLQYVNQKETFDFYKITIKLGNFNKQKGEIFWSYMQKETILALIIKRELFIISML